MDAHDYSEDLRVLLYLGFKWVENYLLRAAKGSEYNYLTLSQIRIFAFMRDCDTTLSDLAKQLNISRQAIQKTIATLVDKGLLELAESPDNRSAKLVKLTERGRGMQTWSREVIDRAETDLAEKIGVKKLRQLKEILGKDWD